MKSIAIRFAFAKAPQGLARRLNRISSWSLGVGCASFILILSVFNGFHDLVISLYGNFHSELTAYPKSGSYLNLSKIQIEQLNQFPGIISWSEVVNHKAILKAKDKLQVSDVKGVGPNYHNTSGIVDMNYLGDGIQSAVLEKGGAYLGAGLAYRLATSPNDPTAYVNIQVPTNSTSAYSRPYQSTLLPVLGAFSIQEELDYGYAFIPISRSRDLLQLSDSTCTSIEFKIERQKVITELERQFPDWKFTTQKEQSAFISSILEIERIIVWGVLSLVIVLVAINQIASLFVFLKFHEQEWYMLSVFGMSRKRIRSTVLTASVLRSAIPILLGCIIGFGIVWLQLQFSLISFGQQQNVVVSAYPVAIHPFDGPAVALFSILVSMLIAKVTVNRHFKVRK